MIEINVPKSIIDNLLQTVINRLGNRVLGDFPFYTRIEKEFINAYMSGWIDVDQICAGYIYGHDETIPLHTDKWKSSSYYNLNIPLYNLDDDQYFMIFDQEFPDRGCEWQAKGIKQKKHQPLTIEDEKTSNQDNDHLKSICYENTKPCDTEVLYLTNQQVNFSIIEYLPFEKDFYFGLSGKVWKQTVGKGLIFKTTQLHGTAKQDKFKVGCVFLLKSQDCLLNL